MNEQPIEITEEMRNTVKLISKIWRENNKEKMREARKKCYETHKNTDEYKEKIIIIIKNTIKIKNLLKKLKILNLNH